jgi:hypothetical protein
MLIHYTLDGSKPNLQSPVYNNPLAIKSSSVLKMFAFNPVKGRSPVITAHFHRIDHERSISIQSQYSTQYTGGGDRALIDGLRGGKDFRNGFWQGYQGQDFTAVVDLGRIRDVYKIGAGFLQDIGSWIWMPVSVRFSVSSDSLQFHEIAVFYNDVPEDLYGSIQKDFVRYFLDLKTRYILVEAEYYGTLPEWHVGAGGQAWIFIDEIMVK